MSKQIQDLSGKRFGTLTVTNDYKQIQEYRSNGSLGGHKTFWRCVCDCGNEKWIIAQSLKKYKYEYCDKCRPQGVRNSRLYHIYYGMLQRCFNCNNPRYQNYGGRGISVATEWVDSFESFKEWSLRNGYTENNGLSIDRINNDDNYSPENCQWIPISENTAKGNVGKVKNKSKLKDMFAVSPTGEKIAIDNISKFSSKYGLNSSSVGAALRGYGSPNYRGWTFHSNMSRKSE